MKHTGIQVQHNNARGPFKGGFRYHPTIDEDHAATLANLSHLELERITRRIVERMKEVIGPTIDVPAPDVNTNAAAPKNRSIWTKRQ